MKEKLWIICCNEKVYSVINIVGVTRFQQNDLWSCRYSAMCSLDQLVNNNFYKNPDAFGFLEDDVFDNFIQEGTKFYCRKLFKWSFFWLFYC